MVQTRNRNLSEQSGIAVGGKTTATTANRKLIGDGAYGGSAKALLPRLVAGGWNTTTS